MLCRTLFWKNPSGGQEGGGQEEVWPQGPVWGASTRGDAGMKGWALAASLDPWCSLVDPPLSWDPGDLGSGNHFFFFLSRGVLFTPEGKAGFLPASSCTQAPPETQGSHSSCCVDRAMGSRRKGANSTAPGCRTGATQERLSYGQLPPAGRTKEKRVGAQSRKDEG